MRGVSTTLGANANGYYLDDAPFTGVTVPISPDVRAWDLERIEVLRGPQGTLFGEGSLGGTIRIITAAPRLDAWEAKADEYVSTTRSGGINEGIKAAFNAPLIGDVLAVRLAGTHEVLPGWIDDAAGGRRNINQERYDTLRAKMLFRPSPRLTLNASYWRYDSSNPIDGSAATDDGQASKATILQNRTMYRQYAASLRYDLGWAQAFYSFSKSTFALPVDGSFAQVALDTSVRIAVDTDEVRLGSTSPGPWQWTIGGYLRAARRNDVVDVPAYAILGNSATDSDAGAMFGDATYRLPFAAIDVSAGLRYYTIPSLACFVVPA